MPLGCTCGDDEKTRSKRARGRGAQPLRILRDGSMSSRRARVLRSFPLRFRHISTVGAHSVEGALSQKFMRFRVDSRGLKRGASISDPIGLKVRKVTPDRSPEVRVTQAGAAGTPSGAGRGADVMFQCYLEPVRGPEPALDPRTLVCSVMSLHRQPAPQAHARRAHIYTL